jgi:hypothetical protein
VKPNGVHTGPFGHFVYGISPQLLRSECTICARLSAALSAARLIFSMCELESELRIILRFLKDASKRRRRKKRRETNNFCCDYKRVYYAF